ncbi:MAG: ribonuclease H-like domain-containing protein [bacterium]
MNSLIETKTIAYLDIETTGLSPFSSDLTVIGLYIENKNEHKIIQLIENEISAEKLLKIIENVEVIYTYNGEKFDLPFIEEKIKINITNYCNHKDLMYECWKRNLYGGQKKVEQNLGITRKLLEVDGKVAIDLWNNYKLYNDKKSLITLLEYNKEDISNLRLIKQALL